MDLPHTGEQAWVAALRVRPLGMRWGGGLLTQAGSPYWDMQSEAASGGGLHPGGREPKTQAGGKHSLRLANKVMTYYREKPPHFMPRLLFFESFK